MLKVMHISGLQKLFIFMCKAFNTPEEFIMYKLPFAILLYLDGISVEGLNLVLLS